MRRTSDVSFLFTVTVFFWVSVLSNTNEDSEFSFDPDVLHRVTAGIYKSSEARGDSDVPRSRHKGEHIHVLWDYAIQKVITFDLKSSTLKVYGWYRLWWTDADLWYNGTEEFGNKWISSSHYVPIDPDRIWTPHIVPFYSDSFFDEETVMKTKAFVYDADRMKNERFNVWWSRPVLLNIHCPDVSLAKFPFDEHMCRLVVGSWHASSTTHRFFAKKSSYDEFGGCGTNADCSIYTQEWNLTKAWLVNKSTKYYSGTFDEVHLHIRLTRHSHFFLVNVVYPMMLLVFLSCLTYWVPFYDVSIDRLGYSATLLLTITATTLFTSEHRPMSQGSTWMDEFQAVCLFLALLPMLETTSMIWMLRLLEHKEDSPPELGKSQSRVLRRRSSGLSVRAPIQILIYLDRKGCIGCLRCCARHQPSSRLKAKSEDILQDTLRIKMMLLSLDSLLGHLHILLAAYCLIPYLNTIWDWAGKEGNSMKSLIFLHVSASLVFVKAGIAFLFFSIRLFVHSYACISGHKLPDQEQHSPFSSEGSQTQGLQRDETLNSRPSDSQPSATSGSQKGSDDIVLIDDRHDVTKAVHHATPEEDVVPTYVPDTSLRKERKDPVEADDEYFVIQPESFVTPQSAIPEELPIKL